MKRVIIAVIVGAFSAVALPTLADSYTPSHSCIKPFKPYEFTDQWQLDRFRNDVATYKRCISDFADEQNEEAENHQEAAEEAIEEWNNYLRFELN